MISHHMQIQLKPRHDFESQSYLMLLCSAQTLVKHEQQNLLHALHGDPFTWPWEPLSTSSKLKSGPMSAAAPPATSMHNISPRADTHTACCLAQEDFLMC